MFKIIMKFKFIIVPIFLLYGAQATVRENDDEQVSFGQEYQNGSVINEKLQNFETDLSEIRTGSLNNDSRTSASNDDLYLSTENEGLHTSTKNETELQETVVLQQLEENLKKATARNGGIALQNNTSVIHEFFKNFLSSLPVPVSSAFTALLPTSAGTNKPEERSHLTASQRKDTDKVSSPAVKNMNSSRVDKICLQDVDPGLCRAYLPRWHFNLTDETCRKFTYGGCHGNKNNFESEYDCYATCTGEIPCKTDPAKVCLIDNSPCHNLNLSFSCPAHPNAVCRVRPCTCEVVFEDEDGETLNCNDAIDQTNLHRAGDTDEQSEVLCLEDPKKVCLWNASACANATCSNNPEAKCTVLPCTCATVFLDRNGIKVQCNASANTTIADQSTKMCGKKNCKNLTTGLLVLVCLVLLLIVLSVGVIRKCRRDRSYALFSGSMSDLAENNRSRQSYTEFAGNKNRRENLV